MRIVIVRRESFDLPDGISDFVFHLSDELLERGHEVTLLSTWKSSPETARSQFARRHYPRLESLADRSSDCRIQTAALWWSRGVQRLAALKPDVVLLNGVIPIRLPYPTVAVSHDLEQRRRWWSPARVVYKRRAYRFSDQIVATCTELADALAAELKVDLPQIAVIPTCVASATEPGLPFARRDRAVLHMGGAGYKGPQDSIAAFGHLNDPTARLYLTGRPNRTTETAMANLPAALRARVEMVGWVPAQRLHELISTVRCVNVPSVYHVPVCSPTVLESFAAGTPVVCSNSITADMIQQEENALAAGNPEEAGVAMKRLLDEEPLWTRLSGNARQTATRFSASAVADRYLALINRLLSR